MKNITKQDMIGFILSQPDEKKVDMLEPRAKRKGTYGCIMVQYAYEKLNHKGCVECGTTVILDKNCGKIGQLDFELREIIENGYLNHSKTFGELKKCLKN
jgi:hypothetical protein